MSASIDFGAALERVGRAQSLLDLRSLRVVPYRGEAVLSGPLAFAETYSTVLEDGELPRIGDAGGPINWTVNDGEAAADATRAAAGNSSLRVFIENVAGGYGYPGVELHIDEADSRADWSRYESLIYDVWPEVNESARDQAPDLYWLKVYGACAGSSVTQGGPPLALDQWNPASVSLRPLDRCWPDDGLDLSSVTRVELHTRDNDTVDGNGGLWDDGDTLTLWLDEVRLVDQNEGTMRWKSLAGADCYYVYFDVLEHEGHAAPELDRGLQAADGFAAAAEPEVGGYFHVISNATADAGLAIWTAPSTEKILPAMAAPVASAPLRIAAARGEFEPFQLVLRSALGGDVIVSASAFAGASGTIPAPRIARVDYVPISSVGDQYDRLGLWPDPLWPLDDNAVVTLPAGSNQPLWFTLRVPWDAPAGEYAATVTIGAAVVPVTLEVWDFALPRQIHLASEWGFDWSQVVELYRGTISDSVEPCYWDVVDALKQQLIDHRLIPKGVAWPAGLNYPGGVEYDCAGHLEPDAWGAWDFATLAGRYVNGLDNFNGGVGFPTFLALGPTSNWPPDSLPYAFCGEARGGVLGSDSYQAALASYLVALNAYLEQSGYAAGAYYHIVNEPQTDDDYATTGMISAFVRARAPQLRQMVSEQVEASIYQYPGAKIDIWMPTISSYEVTKSQDRQRDYNEQVWWYYLYGDDPPLPNPILMGHPGMEARITPWLAWRERVDGLLHYSTTDWSKNPWVTPNVTGQDNGDGFLFYPPRKDGGGVEACGENGNRLVPSLRWEQLRDGMEDYEYLWLLAGGKPQVGVVNDADSFVSRLVGSRTRFSHVPTDLAETRSALAAALASPSPAVPAAPWPLVAVAAAIALALAPARLHPGPASRIMRIFRKDDQ
ncbi:MAG: DUF4091 domain-containing protein [Candidatus Schekmanbacteria bacterium]|nr:DUF4091 domain-containing protein [Candidatus Schekmanbacteria bacterium]